MAAAQNVILCRKFHLKIESANDLPNVREVFDTRAYTVVSIGSADQKISSKTKPDKKNGLNPVWNHIMSFNISDAGVHNYGLSVVIKLYTARTFGDRYIGEFHTTIKDLYDHALPNGGSAKQSVQIKHESKETEAQLNFCYSFEETFSVEKSDFLRRLNVGGLVLQVISTVVGVAAFIVEIL